MQARFRALLAAAGVTHPALDTLAVAVRDAWSDRTPREQYRARLKALQLAASAAKADAAELHEKLKRYEAAEQANEQAATEAAQLALHIRTLEQQKNADRARIDDLRAKLFEAKERIRTTTAELASQKDVGAYVSFLSRATTLTRTRLDYERSVLSLSAEQQAIVDAIGEHGDYLVRGPAGTGKTLVLMHAVNRERERIAGELGFDDHTQLAVYTFNYSLVRFNRYLATILGTDMGELTISNVDALFATELEALGYTITYDRKALGALHDSSGQKVLPTDLFIIEVEEFILGNNLTREQYVDEVIPRRGLKVPLRREQRAEVWDAAERVWQQTDASAEVSRARGVKILYDHIAGDAAVRERLSCRRIFLDEAQDLSAIEIALLRMLSRNGLVICGDEQQRLYRFGGSFLQSGVDIRGSRSRTLTTNYRNTVEICELSERYRAACGIETAEHGLGTAFRHGPDPECFVLPNTDTMWSAFVARVEFFVHRLGYAPENLAVLAPFKNFTGKAARLLEAAGFETCSVLDPEFDFESTSGVRLSTMHSAKGLEFPVVFLIVPALAADERIDAEEAEARMQNLVYVSMTRGMDNLQVFVTEAGVEGSSLLDRLVTSV